MSQFRNLSELYLELRDRLDEATISTLAQHPEATLQSFIRVGAERVARRSRGVRRLMPIFLPAGRRIPVGKFRFMEALDQLRLYSTWSYGRITALGLPGSNVSDLAFDPLENRVFSIDLNEARLDVIAGETSLWSFWTDIVADPPATPFRVVAPALERSVFTCGFNTDTILEFDKSTGAQSATHTIAGGFISSIAYDPSRVDLDPPAGQSPSHPPNHPPV